MNSKSLPSILHTIIENHLTTILDFNPFANFPGVKSNSDFLNIIRDDPAFSNFSLDREKYAVSRFGGNLITSLHRKIGDLYEEVVTEILSSTLGVSIESLKFALTIRINEELQERSTDGRILFDEITISEKKERAIENAGKGYKGLALEVRSCYQIGDSKRIQADRDMALALKNISLKPVMLIFCATSLRSPVIRLREFWDVREGKSAFEFISELTGFDLFAFLTTEKLFIQGIMDKVFSRF